ncbi:hypothetical protein ACJZ2D_001147 [Fusarium nematophilum]
MPATPRQKACITCAESKCRCDKQLPECQRCLDRDVDCRYPPSKRRPRGPTARHQEPAGEASAQRDDAGAGILVDADIEALGSNGLDLGDWGEMAADGLYVSLPDIMIPYAAPVPSGQAPRANLSTQRVGPESDEMLGKSPSSCPWFLRAETWDMQQHTNQEPACVTTVELEPFVRAVEGMLGCWIKNVHNGFTHRRLYEHGMPACIQDAFTTLAAYKGCTPAVKDTILQIAEDRSHALVIEGAVPATASGGGGAQGILNRLARVQALFVYEFMRLFDGSVRHRASAEKQLPTLRRWVTDLWESVRRFEGNKTS